MFAPRRARASISASLALVVVALSLAACTHAVTGGSEATSSGAPEDPRDPSAVLAESRAKGVVLASLETHDKKVQILGRLLDAANGTTDPEALRVVVHTRDGALLADGVTVAELQRVDPALHALVTSALASNGTYLDATLQKDLTRTNTGGAFGPAPRATR